MGIADGGSTGGSSGPISIVGVLDLTTSSVLDLDLSDNADYHLRLTSCNSNTADWQIQIQLQESGETGYTAAVALINYSAFSSNTAKTIAFLDTSAYASGKAFLPFGDTTDTSTFALTAGTVDIFSPTDSATTTVVQSQGTIDDVVEGICVIRAAARFGTVSNAATPAAHDSVRIVCAQTDSTTLTTLDAGKIIVYKISTATA